MKKTCIISTAALFLLLGSTAIAYAQHEERGNEGKGQSGQQHQQPAQQRQQPAQPQHQQPAQQQHQQQAGRPASRQVKQQPAYGGVYHGGVRPSGPTNGGVHQSGVPQHQGQVRAGFSQSRARSWNDDHRTWGQRGGYNGYRVPQERFGLYFGSNHYFSMYGLPMLFVGGYPRFQYDGYWVTFVDPWPEAWSPTWYQTDQVYIDYSDGGYYLYNRAHPGIGIAVSMSL
jgi:hypothetical protein